MVPMDPQPVRKRSIDHGASRARLAQFAGSTDVKGASVGIDGSQSCGNDSYNWPHAMIFCGSNSFNQLSGQYGELMTANFIHIPNPMFSGVELVQVSCGGNQTAALVSGEGSAEPQASSKTPSTKLTTESTDKHLQYQLYLWGAGKSASQMRVPVPLPPRCNIAQISCGHTHMGFVTEKGQAFTWGAGDHGMLGHGTKSAVNEPRRVETFKTMVCTTISCGAFHTAFIACNKDDVTYTRLPNRPPTNSSLGVGRAGERIVSSEECAAGGSLYMCGLGKAGQLGLADKIPISGANAGCVARPTLVPFFEEEGARVIRVSCGFHHTLAIAVPKQAVRVFSPSVYAFGFGEYGRLGNGSEEQLSIPTLVQFPAPFHATQVSAGEQHSVALGHDGCYAWGSNDMGQLGIGSSPNVEFAALPQKVQLPEGMVPRKIAAGGRHTGVVTHCGNVLCWGWGEEGQLGNGTEKSSSLPRPCRLIKVQDRPGVPMDIALGGTHTVVVLHNPGYIAPSPPEPETTPPKPDTPEPVPERCPTPPVPEPQPEPEPEPAVEPLQQSIEVPEVVMMPPVEHKPPMISTDDDFAEEEAVPTPAPPPQLVRGLKDILQQREERRAAAALLEVQEPPAPEPEPAEPPATVEVEERPPEPVAPEPEPEPEPLAPVEAEAIAPTGSTKERIEGSALFNNITARAEIRKARKASVNAFGSSSKKG